MEGKGGEMREQERKCKNTQAQGEGEKPEESSIKSSAVATSNRTFVWQARAAAAAKIKNN